MVQLLVVKIGGSRCCEICSVGAVREVVQLVVGLAHSYRNRGNGADVYF